MKKIAYITPAVRVKNVAPLSIMQGSLDPTNPTSGLDPEPLNPGGDDPGDFAKKGGDFNVWED